MKKQEIKTEILVEQAKNGNDNALDLLIRRIQDHVYGLAIRMLWHPEDAKDATQEILVKIITHLGNFRGEAAFKTWVYRIATNHLLTTRKRRAEREKLSFELFEQQLSDGLSISPPQYFSGDTQELLLKEIKIGCMQGMLLCLDRNHRVTYILGEIFKVNSEEGSYILDISLVAFRKRLSRARNKIRTFMKRNCGLVQSNNPCRCNRQIGHGIRSGRVNPDQFLFADHPAENRQNTITMDLIHEMDELEKAAALYRTHPDYTTPEIFVESMKKLINSGNFRVL